MSNAASPTRPLSLESVESTIARLLTIRSDQRGDDKAVGRPRRQWLPGLMGLRDNGTPAAWREISASSGRLGIGDLGD
ncbi:hypothetical protein J6590_034697 [Homalodisca vitripennis]|nr:hypothetical protein J6590_094185 [Homalodisca vitripennis]KAG8302384.1 hypothetical protein J6590_034697 [Homalodisca vitripennis]